MDKKGLKDLILDGIESDEYIIEDLENWYCVNGGMVCISSTLNNIIDSIEEYL